MKHHPSPKVIRVLRGEHLTLSAMEEMLEKAAITRLHGMNRRYMGWLFFVQEDKVLNMVTISPVVKGRGPERMQEECPNCGGSACRKCGWYGHIYRRVNHTRCN